MNLANPQILSHRSDNDSSFAYLEGKAFRHGDIVRSLQIAVRLFTITPSRKILLVSLSRNMEAVSQFWGA